MLWITHISEKSTSDVDKWNEDLAKGPYIVMQKIAEIIDCPIGYLATGFNVVFAYDVNTMTIDFEGIPF